MRRVPLKRCETFLRERALPARGIHEDMTNLRPLERRLRTLSRCIAFHVLQLDGTGELAQIERNGLAFERGGTCLRLRYRVPAR